MKRVLLIILFWLVAMPAFSQFYDSGRPSGFRRWQTISDDTTKVIFSKGSEAVAELVLQYMQQERAHLWDGYQFPPQIMPLIIWSGTAFSNGLAMQAPRRVEFVAMPSVDSYSDPWLWQLAVHEGRHTVQYGNINRNTVKALSYVFGEQVELVASGLLPFWMLEGDAVLHETLSSEWGRGEQPSFAMHYRALGEDMLHTRNVDKWFCGSYNEFVPDHYAMGYQLVKYLYNTTGRVVANDVADYTSKYPFLIFTTQLALKKYYGLYTPGLFRRTFVSFVTEQNQFGIPEEDSAVPITAEPKSYTIYSYPQFLNDTTIIALKKDFDDYSRFVSIDTRTGAERFVRHTGYVSTRPDLKDGRLVWTEYRRDMVWDGEYDSRVVSMNVDGSNVCSVTSSGMATFPTFEGDGSVAYLRYEADGGYVLVHSGGEVRLSGVEKSYHGLAWSNGRFYMIALTEDGMYIEEYDPETDALQAITAPAKHTLSDLRADENGILNFGSIENGLDEVYAIDLSDQSMYRLTSSRYGAFNPSNERNGNVALTTYSKKGYGIAVQNMDEGAEEISSLEFQVSADTIISSQRDTIDYLPQNPKSYSKLGHLFHIHSWMPLNVDYDGIMAGEVAVPTIGATLLSQNMLSTSFAQFNYGYDINTGHQSVKGSWRYEGFMPKLQLSATWSNVAQRIYTPSGVTPSAEPAPNDYSLTLSAMGYLPLVLSDGYHRRTLTPLVQYAFNNIKRYYFDDKYRYGTTFAVQLNYSDYVKMAKRDLYPKWGYALSGGYITDNPLGSTTEVFTAYGKLYTPGFWKNHSFSFEVTYQRQRFNEKTSGYFYPAQYITPRGVASNSVFGELYGAVSLNYALPLVYPDWGIQGVFFLQRIWARLGADAGFWIRNAMDFDAGSSIGGTISFDITPFRMPDNATTTLSFSIFFPTSSNTPYWGFGFSAPI